MRKLSVIMAMALALAACHNPFGDYKHLADVPGVDPGKGNNYNSYTTYQGALLPDPEFDDREDMVKLLNLIGQQKSQIDDNLFVARLVERVFSCDERFMYIHAKDGSEPDRWSDAGSWVGGRMYYNMSMSEDNTFVQTREPGCGDWNEAHNYLYNQGIKGTYYNGVWEYDADTNTLYTSEDGKYVAEVLYFDGEYAVLLGFVYPMSLYNGSEYRRETPMELYGFKFYDTKDEYLEGYITPEEYNALIEEYTRENLMFEDWLLPRQHRGEMLECIELLDKQQAEDIDDEAFVRQLTTKRLNCEERFVVWHDDTDWGWGQCTSLDELGYLQWIGDMVGAEDGSFYTRTAIYHYHDYYDHLQAEGIYGYYESGMWSYDEESNTLITEVRGHRYEAKVCYYDSAKGDMVLRGSVGFNYHADTVQEMLRCKFYDDTEGFLDGYYTRDELSKILQALPAVE